MNKKTLIVGTIILVFLIGIASASLLTYFGKITGTAMVSEPVFYLTNESAEGDAPALAYKLFTNVNPSEEGIVNFTDGNGWDATYFVTEPLDVDYFYKAEFIIHLLIKTNRTENQTQPVLNITVIKLDGSTMNPICSTSKSIGATTNYGYNTFSCSSEDIINMTNTPKLGLKLIGEKGVEYYIKTGHKYGSEGYSEMKVTAA